MYRPQCFKREGIELRKTFNLRGGRAIMRTRRQYQELKYSRHHRSPRPWYVHKADIGT